MKLLSYQIVRRAGSLAHLCFAQARLLKGREPHAKPCTDTLPGELLVKLQVLPQGDRPCTKRFRALWFSFPYNRGEQGLSLLVWSVPPTLVKNTTREALASLCHVTLHHCNTHAKSKGLQRSKRTPVKQPRYWVTQSASAPRNSTSLLPAKSRLRHECKGHDSSSTQISPW